MRDDKSLLEDILRYGRALERYLTHYGKTFEDIENDEILQWTITTPLYNVGECVYQLSNELKECYPAIPWFRVSGLRHRLVHDYRGTNWSIIAQTALHDIPEFLDQIESVLSDVCNK